MGSDTEFLPKNWAELIPFLDLTSIPFTAERYKTNSAYFIAFDLLGPVTGLSGPRYLHRKYMRDGQIYNFEHDMVLLSGDAP